MTAAAPAVDRNAQPPLTVGKEGARMPSTTTLAARTAAARRTLIADRRAAEAVRSLRRRGRSLGAKFGVRDAIGGRGSHRPVRPLAPSPEISARFWDFQAAEEQYTTLSARERQALILAVGAVWRSRYELYAHSAVAVTADLRPEQADTLAGGEMPDELSTRDRVGKTQSAAKGSGGTSASSAGS